MPDNIYCSVRFKTGVELDAALSAALHSCDDANRAEAAANRAEQIASELDPDGTLLVPAHWQTYLDEKITAIKSLQEEGGKDAFSFVVITDAHYESNLGKCAPVLAKRIMDACGIKYCLCLGDSQTRHGARHDTEYILAEWDSIETMFKPIRDRLLMQLGNHDGSYGIVDADGDGVADDINADGVVDANDKCVYNLTPQALYERVFRKVSTIDGVKFDQSGSAFYVDDHGTHVRYILLNSHCNKYEEFSNGTAANNNMTHFRFGQAQYDFLVQDALATVPDEWSVIVGCHVPLDRTQEYIYWGGEINENGSLADGSVADCTIMQGLLNAYAEKTTYEGSFAGGVPNEDNTPPDDGGNDTPSADYTNYADPNSSDWAAESRINSSGEVVSNAGTVVTNFIPCSAGDTIRFKNATVATGQRFAFYDANKNYIDIVSVSGVTSGGALTSADATGVQTLVNMGATTPDGAPLESLDGFAYVRFVLTVNSGAKPIVTVNEEITTGSGNGGSTSGGETSYTNLADKTSSDWKAKSYINSSGAVADATATDVTNFIPAPGGSVLRFRGVTPNGRIAFYDADKNYLSIIASSVLVSNGALTTDEATGVVTYHKVGATTADGEVVSSIASTAYVRVTVDTGSENPIITVDEEIPSVASVLYLGGNEVAVVSEAEETRYDAVYVNADFTNAKGELISLFAGHVHSDMYWRPGLIYNNWADSKFGIITTRSDARAENTSALADERVVGTTTEQSFDVFTVNRATRTINATKIGAGADRVFPY